MLAGGPISRQFADRSFPVELPEHGVAIDGTLGVGRDQHVGAAPLCPHCGCHLRSERTIDYGNIAASQDGRLVFEGAPLNLQRRLHDIALALVRAEGRSLTRSQLAFGLSSDASDEAIVKAVERLRRHFRQLRPGFDQIETIRGFESYRWKFRPKQAGEAKLG